MNLLFLQQQLCNGKILIPGPGGHLMSIEYAVSVHGSLQSKHMRASNGNGFLTKNDGVERRSFIGIPVINRKESRNVRSKCYYCLSS